MSILNNEIRIGRFTSSQIHRLCGAAKRKMTADELAQRPKTGKGSSVTTIEDYSTLSDEALNYIAEKNIERKIGRSLFLEKQTRATLTGHYLEQRVHDMLPTSYRLIGKKSLAHPQHPYWVGSPDNDCAKESVVGDTKCYEPKAFTEYVDCLEEAKRTKNILLFKENFPQQYWQLLSNACILGMDNIEAIVYIPYFSELEEIRQSVLDLDADDDKKKYGFIAYSHYNELSWIADGFGYKNLNIFRFVAPKEDKEFLTNKVTTASQLLNK